MKVESSYGYPKSLAVEYSAQHSYVGELIILVVEYSKCYLVSTADWTMANRSSLYTSLHRLNQCYNVIINTIPIYSHSTNLSMSPW